MFWRRRDDAAPHGDHDSVDPVLERLSAYLDDELTDAERREVDALLEHDAAAREMLADLRLLTGALGTLEEVRAPRSFAIPASASGRAPGASVAFFRRFELVVRASAAVAALFFVVALVNDPGGQTPVVNTTASQGAAVEAFSAMDSASGGPAPALEPPAGAGEAASALSADADDAAAEDAPADGQLGALAAPAGTPDPEAGGVGGGLPETADATPGDAPVTPAAPAAPAAPATEEQTGEGAEQAPAGDVARATGPAAAEAGTPVAEQLVPGTEFAPPASEGVGGMAPALGALALLLAALAVLMARDRAGDTTR